jgi:CheY-like chemotaxis protein
MDQLAPVLEALASLAWPLIVIIILFAFRETIRTVLESARSRKFTVKIAGNELTMEEANEQQRLLISDLQTQIVAIQKKLEGVTPSGAETNLLLEAMPTPSRTKSVLWVDDEPRNNAVLTETLTERGIDVILATSTADALAQMQRRSFDFIISDMGRREGQRYNATAGLDLTRQARTNNIQVPIVIYTSSRSARENREQVLAAGATEITSSPTVLLSTLRFDSETSRG